MPPRPRERADLHWLIVGDGRQAAWIREQIVARGLQRTVYMLGRFTRWSACPSSSRAPTR